MAVLTVVGGNWDSTYILNIAVRGFRVVARWWSWLNSLMNYLRPVLLLSFLMSQPMTYPRMTMCFSFVTIDSRTM